MSIDGRGPSLSRSAQDRISALVSENGRLKANAKQSKAFVADQAERYAAEISEVLGERDRARGTGVELEQQLAAIQSGVDDLHRLYERREVDIAPDPLDAARDVIAAVQDVLSLVTNVVLNDIVEDEATA
jgi:hypothetical protein